MSLTSKESTISNFLPYTHTYSKNTFQQGS